MRRFLCFSLCLGLMVSACKKKSIEDSVNKAITQAKAGAGGGDDGGDGGGTTVKKQNKEAVLKACLPKINAELIKKWNGVENEAFYLRRSTVWKTTKADPLVVLYVHSGSPLAFKAGTTTGLGEPAATVTTNLNKMAASEVIQNQFVARDGNASGWRVHISLSNTDVAIPQSENGQPPEVPETHTGKIIIYDRENVNADGVWSPGLLPNPMLELANSDDYKGGWFECVVNDTTEAVTFKYTDADLTEA